jgi:hypothetical protein
VSTSCSSYVFICSLLVNWRASFVNANLMSADTAAGVVAGMPRSGDRPISLPGAFLFAKLLILEEITIFEKTRRPDWRVIY